MLRVNAPALRGTRPTQVRQHRGQQPERVSRHGSPLLREEWESPRPALVQVRRGMPSHPHSSDAPFELKCVCVGKTIGGVETPAKRCVVSPRPSTAASASARRWYGGMKRRPIEAHSTGESSSLSCPVFSFPSLAPSHAPLSGRAAEEPVHCSARTVARKPRPVQRLAASEVAWRTRIARLGLSPLSGFSPEQVLAPLSMAQLTTAPQPRLDEPPELSKRHGSPR